MKGKTFLRVLCILILCESTISAQQHSNEQNEKKVTTSRTTANLTSGAYLPSGNPASVSLLINATISIGESNIKAYSPCADKTTPTHGVIVDPLQPDFELYTSKFVLLRTSFYKTEAKVHLALRDIAETGSKGIIILPGKEIGDVTLQTTNSFPIPVVVIAPADSSRVIRAAQRREQVSIQIK